MRWLVEVSSLGKTDTQKFCVEAESWQRALQAARSQRGEDGPMSGFSIELLEEGYRAVDPLARVRFVVKKAPDDMPITAVPSKEATRVGGGVAPTAPNPPSPASVKAPSIAPPAPAAPPAAAAPAAPAAPPAPAAVKVPVPAVSSAPNSGSNDATTPNLPPSPSSSSVSGKKAPPRPGQSQPPPAGSGTAHLAGTVDSKKKNETMVFTSSGDANVVERPVERAAPPAIGSPVPGLPAVKLLTSREQNPNDASPLTYREYAFAVADGTSEDSAADVLRAQLRYVEAHIATAKTGKLVNLAVFDVEFTGKPPRAPLATLTWKDWKGEPVIGFPRRGGSQSKPPRPPSKMPESLAAAPGVSIPQAAPVPQNLQPVVTHSSTQPVSQQDAQLAQQAAAAQIAQQQAAAQQAHAMQQQQ
ncbi:MAG: hypothetical protein QOI41_3602, partial [Myxococcales bacterium]|nr:hypothetical protein [Myxococcales bacterium]